MAGTMRQPRRREVRKVSSHHALSTHTSLCSIPINHLLFSSHITYRPTAAPNSDSNIPEDSTNILLCYARLKGEEHYLIVPSGTEHAYEVALRRIGQLRHNTI